MTNQSRVENSSVVVSNTLYPWVVLALAWLALLMSFIDRLTWANVAVVVGQSLSLPLAALGVFVTAFYAGYVIANALGGFVSDRAGPRVAILCSLVPLGIATFVFAETKSITFGLICQALMGLAAGIDYSACVKLVMMWFGKEKRGRAMGLLTTATSLGVVVVNAIVPTLMNSSGWENVYRVFGAATIAVGIIVYFALRRPAPVMATPQRSAPWREVLDLFSNRSLRLLALGGFAAMWGTWGFAFWANTLMVKGHQISVVDAGAVVSIFGIGAVISKPTIGYLSDWLGGRRKPLLVLCFVGFAATLLIYGNLSQLWQFRILAPILGVCAFAYTPLLAAMIGETVGVARTGSATGLTNSVWQLGSVIVPGVIGVVYQSSGSFIAAFATLAAGPALAAICMMLIREARD